MAVFVKGLVLGRLLRSFELLSRPLSRSSLLFYVLAGSSLERLTRSHAEFWEPGRGWRFL
jgi:hypothetical protein